MVARIAACITLGLAVTLATAEGDDAGYDRELGRLVSELAALDRSAQALDQRVARLEGGAAPDKEPLPPAQGTPAKEADRAFVDIGGLRFPKPRKFKHSYKFERETFGKNSEMLFSSRMYLKKEGKQGVRWDYAWARVGYDVTHAPPPDAIFEITFKNRWRSSIRTYKRTLVVLDGDDPMWSFTPLKPNNWDEGLFEYTTFYLRVPMGVFLEMARAKKLTVHFGSSDVIWLRLRPPQQEAMAELASRMLPATK